MPGLARSRWLSAGAIALGGLALVAAFAAIGRSDGELAARAVTIAYTLGVSGVPPAMYLLGALGLGRLLAPLFGNSPDRWALQAAGGLGAMLTVSHGLGVLGLLSMPVAAGVVGVGVVLLAHQLAQRRGEMEPRLPAWVLLAVPPGALLLVAACSPPGWLWDSEAGGFDALAYHLQLPKEWLAAGRIEPLPHNVYSYLPGYIESAYAHLGAMCGAGSQSGKFPGLLAGEAWLLTSCQLLHAGMTLMAAWLVARAGAAAARVCGAEVRAARVGGALGGALFLATPWTVVVGSLAYNEAGMVALGAGAMIAALDASLAPWRRGALAGGLVGVACGCKPTALLLIGPPVGIVLLGLSRPREWAPLVVAGVLAGLATIAPWLTRNALCGGNPVFPMLASVFGPAHWSDEQLARYAAGHSFQGTLLERLRLLVLPEADATGLVSRHRGVLHPQWAAFFPAAALAGVLAVCAKPSRRLALLLAAGAATQVVAWLFFTHLQSRFLIPLALTGCVLASLAAAGPWARAARPLLAGIVLFQIGAAAWRFSAERDGRPNAMLIAGPGAMTGELYAGVPPADGLILSPEAALNLDRVNLARPQGLIYLLGDSTPLYFAVPVLYHSTWDRSPLGEAIRAAPHDPAAWTAALRQAGVRFVLVNPSELRRLHQSGWYDPAVTADRVQPWLERHARPVHEWAQSGRYLFELGAP